MTARTKCLCLCCQLAPSVKTPARHSGRISYTDPVSDIMALEGSECQVQSLKNTKNTISGPMRKQSTKDEFWVKESVSVCPPSLVYSSFDWVYLPSYDGFGEGGKAPPSEYPDDERQRR